MRTQLDARMRLTGVALYVLDAVTGWYALEQGGADPLPSRLKVEATKSNNIAANGARALIHGPMENGRWSFMTGLRPVSEYTGWREGNFLDDRSGGKRLVLFRKGGSLLTVAAFDGYEIRKDVRTAAIRSFCAHVEAHGALDLTEFLRQMSGVGTPVNGNGGE